MKKTAAVIVLVIAFAALIAFRGYQKRQVDSALPEPEILKVSVTKIEEHSFSEDISFSASIEPNEQAAVAPKVAGATVLRVDVREGDVVKSGQTMALLDSSLADRQLSQARVAWETSEKDYRRYEALYGEEIISRQQLDHARSQYVQAGAAYEQASLLRGYHTITAPISGVVARRLIDPGDGSNPQSPAFVIFARGDLKAVGAITEERYVLAAPGLPAVVLVDAMPGKPFQAKVTRVSPLIDPVTRTGEVEVALPSDGILKPGMFARVAIRAGERTAFSLPMEAVHRLAGTGDNTCYIVSGDVAYLRMIKTGAEQGNRIEVTGGLLPDEEVVLTRSQKLRDGADIEVVRK